jgi:uncharacterized protein YndB with AHSA1/START domain
MMTQKSVVAKAELLIRKPVAEVFEAFINPEITTQFWFTKSSGLLEAGKQIQWTWEMYNLSTPVHVRAIEPNKRILIDWGTDSTLTTVEWIFTPYKDNTFVSVTNSGFTGTDDEIIQQALGSTEGFTLLLAGLKAFLEHNIHLNLTLDRFPNGTPE